MKNGLSCWGTTWTLCMIVCPFAYCFGRKCDIHFYNDLFLLYFFLLDFQAVQLFNDIFPVSILGRYVKLHCPCKGICAKNTIGDCVSGHAYQTFVFIRAGVRTNVLGNVRTNTCRSIIQFHFFTFTILYIVEFVILLVQESHMRFKDEKSS